MEKTSPLPKRAEPPQSAAARSWDAHLAKEPSAREPNEQASTETVRLQGHVVEVLTGRVNNEAGGAKGWRFRLVRESDGAVIFDCGRFGPKTAYRNMIKKAINAQFEVNRMKADQE